MKKTLIALMALSGVALGEYSWDASKDYSYTLDFSQENTQNGKTGVLGGSVTNTFTTESITEIGTAIKKGSDNGGYWKSGVTGLNGSGCEIANMRIAYTGAPILESTTVPAPVVSPWAVELGAGYNNAAKSLFHSGGDWFGPQKKVNTWSWDLTGVYKLDENNALTFRLGYAYGNRQQEEVVRLITNTWSLMPGYRYTYALNDKWSAFAGANVGLVSFAWLDKEDPDLGNNHKSGWGFGYSAELGVRYAVCGNWEAFVAYHFCGDTASSRHFVTRGGQYTSMRSKKQNFHGVRIGVGYKF